jgi:hypothetical protein
MSTEMEKLKKEFATEISAGEEKARAEGRAEGRGISPGVAVAERMAARARVLQAADPTLSNVEATRRAYQEAKEKVA